MTKTEFKNSNIKVGSFVKLNPLITGPYLFPYQDKIVEITWSKGGNLCKMKRESIFEKNMPRTKYYLIGISHIEKEADKEAYEKQFQLSNEDEWREF